jgi:DNA-binding phage protein
MEDLAQKRGTILEKWLDQTLASYPSQTSRFLRNERDRFRNPVGHTLKEGLATLLDEITGEMDTAKIKSALESIVRLRAVQDFTAAQATGFVFTLREILYDNLEGGGPPSWQKRIDEVALLAFDLYMRCREEIYEIKAREGQREVYVWERMCRRAQGEST